MKKAKSTVSKEKKKKKLEKKSRMQYSKEKMVLAVEEVKRGSSIIASARKFAVPESTLRAKLQNKYNDKKPGPSSFLSQEQEKEIVDWLFCCSKAGFPITKSQLLQSVQAFCVNLKIKNPFTDNKPGRSWYGSFVKRHPEISVRILENVNLNKAKVSEDTLKQWFTKTSEYLSSENVLDIEPNRIFTSDKTGISIVLASTKSKNRNKREENIKVLVTGNAAGDLAPTFILFTGKSIPKNAALNAPPDFSFGCNESGWMLAKTFYDYMVNKFEPWLTEKKIERPVVFFIDGHSSYITLPLSKFCSEHKIVLVALHPNATHLLQPLDVSFFNSLKNHWQQIHGQVCENSASKCIKKNQFAQILKSTLGNLDVKKLLQSGFQKCGLYPLDAEAPDYKPLYPSNPRVEDVEVIERYLSTDQLQRFRDNEDFHWIGPAEDKNLFTVWCQAKLSSGNLNDPTDLKENEGPETSVDQVFSECVSNDSKVSLIANNDVNNLFYTTHNSVISLMDNTNSQNISNKSDIYKNPLINKYNNTLEISVKEYLTWSTDSKLNSTSKISKQRLKLPLIVSGDEWQKLQETKENENE
ncbi:uncharacterized protein LOC106641424 [Copidosoma floridanum]|uniref:uncharacterized protein LOC106641424 n=1 Tax=Copidosoma floridanum TaxID=29053 RepID=UPI0006C9626D|nr:uncharacterized protein LOC106641424 [Copidosoma floridanum]